MNQSNKGPRASTQHALGQSATADEFLAVPSLNFSRIAFFSSHGGSGTRGVVGACGQGLNASPAIVISNNPDSAIMGYAKDAKITHEVINVKVCGSEAGVQERILGRLRELGVDLIILSGYMKKLGPEIVAQHSGRIFNIHPALLPKYGGHGMYGMNVHRAVIEAKEVETGITIHHVDCNYDEGPIVSRLRISVDPHDTVESLAEKVKKEEPSFLVRTLLEMQRLSRAQKSASE